MWCLIRRANSSPQGWATRSWWIPLTLIDRNLREVFNFAHDLAERGIRLQSIADRHR